MDNALKFVLSRAATGFLVGGFESALRQLVVDGKIDWEQFFKDAGFSAAMAGISATLEYSLYKDKVCFVAGTMVLTSKGPVAIEDVSVSDLVLARNLISGTNEYKPVTRLYRNATKELVALSVGGDIIRTTPEHPFYDVDTGWVEARALTTGNHLMDRDATPLPIDLIERIEEEAPTYNLEVMGHHNYFVSLLGLLVHNACNIDPDDIVLETDSSKITKQSADQTKYTNSKRANKVGDVLGEWDDVAKRADGSGTFTVTDPDLLEIMQKGYSETTDTALQSLNPPIPGKTKLVQKNGFIDLSDHAIVEMKYDYKDYPEIKDVLRRDLHDSFDNKLMEHFNTNKVNNPLTQKPFSSIDDVRKWRSANQLTWHEQADMVSVILVPTELNAKIKHIGGTANQAGYKLNTK